MSEGDRPLRVTDADYYTLKRYEAFRAAADYVASAFAGQPSVRRVALFGSVASPPIIGTGRSRRGQFHEPTDVDLAVWLDHVDQLHELRKLSAKALQRLWQEKELGVAHHQVDVFLFDATGMYMGRLCHFNQCPKDKPECRVDRCGEVPFLQQHDGFDFDSAQSLRRDRVQVLFERQ